VSSDYIKCHWWIYVMYSMTDINVNEDIMSSNVNGNECDQWSIEVILLITQKAVIIL